MSSSRGLSGHKSMTMTIIKRADKLKKQEGWSEYRITVNGQPYIHWGGKRMTKYPKPQINNQVESVNEVSGVDVAKKVLKNKQREKGIDLQTANLIVTIDKAYDKNPKLQKKFRAIQLPKMKQLIMKYYG